MEIKTVRYADLELDNPVAIIGFPSSGLVSSIAANYYVSQLKMPVIAGFAGPDMPPYSFIYSGHAYPPIRVYGYKSKEKRGKKGKDVVICLSEYAPKPEQCYDVVHAICTYLRSIGSTEIICLEGIPKMNEEDSMVVCGSGDGSREMIKKTKLKVMDSGMVRGTTGVMLYNGPLFGFDVMAVIVPGNQNLPDPGSAAGIVAPVSKVVPGFKVDTSMLLKEADEIDKRLQQEQSVSVRDDSTQIYG